MPKRTDTAERVFEYLRGYIQEHNKSPEMGEIKEHFGFGSMGTVYYHIKRLEREVRIEVSCIRGMKKYSDIKVKWDKMRNLDAFNAMSRDGQRNFLIQFLKNGPDELYVESNKTDVEILVDALLEWLYSPAE